MTEEIRFRAISKENGKWIYSTNSSNASYDAMCLSLFWMRVEAGIIYPETIGQYTGRKDRDGVLFPDKHKRMYLVCLEDCSWVLKFLPDTGDADDFDFISNYNDEHLGVVGNRHSNPELLEV